MLFKFKLSQFINNTDTHYSIKNYKQIQDDLKIYLHQSYQKNQNVQSKQINILSCKRNSIYGEFWKSIHIDLDSQNEPTQSIYRQQQSIQQQDGRINLVLTLPQARQPKEIQQNQKNNKILNYSLFSKRLSETSFPKQIQIFKRNGQQKQTKINETKSKITNQAMEIEMQNVQQKQMKMFLKKIESCKQEIIFNEFLENYKKRGYCNKIFYEQIKKQSQQLFAQLKIKEQLERFIQRIYYTNPQTQKLTQLLHKYAELNKNSLEFQQQYNIKLKILQLKQKNNFQQAEKLGSQRLEILKRRFYFKYAC